MQKHTILLVEDDYNIANIYKIKLDLAGYAVQHGVHGLEGLALAKRQTPSLVLLDLRMPIMDGETFLHRFRKVPEWVDIPVIVLTNISREEAPKTLWHQGISGYFVKANHTPSDLVSIIDNILR